MGVLMNNKKLEIPVYCHLNIEANLLKRCDESLSHCYNCSIDYKHEYIHKFASEYIKLLKNIETQVFKGILRTATENGRINPNNEYSIVYLVNLDIGTNKTEFIKLMNNIELLFGSDSTNYEIFKKTIISSNNNQAVLKERKWNDCDDNCSLRIIKLDSELEKYRKIIFLMSD